MKLLYARMLTKINFNKELTAFMLGSGVRLGPPALGVRGAGEGEFTGADPAFVIRGGPNWEYFLSNLRKLLKRGKFFITTPSLMVKRNWVYINQFTKTCFLLTKTLNYLILFCGGFLFKIKARDGSGNIEKGGGELTWLDMVYFMIILVKRGR